MNSEHSLAAAAADSKQQSTSFDAPHTTTSQSASLTANDGLLPLDGSTTTTLSFESGFHPALTTTEIATANANLADQLSNQQASVLTETLSSFTSNRSSIYNGLGNNNNLLSTFSSTTSSASRRSSMQMSKVEVRETLDASLTENADGFHQLKQYILLKEIGKGAFGKVHLAQDENTRVRYAIKEFSKSKLRKKDKANLFKLGPRGRGRGRRGPEAPSPLASESSPLDLIRGEVAILKKLHHPNIVKLYEVLDVAAADSMYMVFEYCEKGVLMPVSLTEKYDKVFSDAECRDVFQQMILGIEYLHEHDIIHRDIKPDNLLRSGDGTVKIVDFGVSEMFNKKGDDLTKKSAGSPAFMAPELCRPDHGEVSGRATDIWSMGVTLFCVRYGTLPYVSESILEMHRVIREEDYEIPGEATEDPRFVSLIRKLLEKDPAKRITIEQLRTDPWVTNDGREPLISKEENIVNAVTEVTEEELRGAFSKIGGLATVVKAIAKLKRGIKSPAMRPQSTASVLQSFDSTISDKMQDAEDDTSTSINGARSTTIHTANDTKTTNNLEESRSPETKKTEEKSTGVEPQGYQVCDFETGMCYWVPNNKSPDVSTVPTPAPEPAVAEKDAKDEVQTHSEEEKEKETYLIPPVEITMTSPAEDTEGQTTTTEMTIDNKKDEAGTEQEPEGYQVCDLATGMCYWEPIKKPKTESEPEISAPTAEEKASAPVENKASSTEHEKLSSPAGQSKDDTENGARTPVSDSGRSLSPAPSPGSVNSGSRNIGKLSKERLAMFENH
ncbi:hypothetical protein FBU30_005921 [Linnemannia zychae]|nr:hypothetical protein FBU30_005921 [Linnemannia zychae]